MAGGSVGYALGGDCDIRVKRVVGGDEPGEVDQVGGERWFAGLVGGLSLIGAHAFRFPLRAF
jgi:hypothetical protein